MLYQFQSERKIRRSRGPVAGRRGAKMKVKVEDGIGNCSSMTDQHIEGNHGAPDDKGKNNGFNFGHHHGGFPVLMSMKNRGRINDVYSDNSNQFNDHTEKSQSEADQLTVSINKNFKNGSEENDEVGGAGIYDGDFNSLFTIPRSQIVDGTQVYPIQRFKNKNPENSFIHEMKDDYLVAPRAHLPFHSVLDYPSYCYSNDYYEVSLVSNPHSSLPDNQDLPFSRPLSLRRDILTASSFNGDDVDTDKSESGRFFSRNTSIDSSLSSQYFATSDCTYSSVDSPSSIDSELVDSLYDFPTYTYEPNSIFRRNQQKHYLLEQQQHSYNYYHHQSDDEGSVSRHNLLSNNFSLSPTPINSTEDNEDHLFGLKLEVPSLVSFTNSNKIQSYVCTLENTIDDENNLNESIFPTRPSSFERCDEDVASQLDEQPVSAGKEETVDPEEKHTEKVGKNISEKVSVVWEARKTRNGDNFPGFYKDGTVKPEFPNACRKRLTPGNHNNSCNNCQCEGDNDNAGKDGSARKSGSESTGLAGRLRAKLEIVNEVKDSKTNKHGLKGVKNYVSSESKIGKLSRKGRKNKVRQVRTRNKNDTEIEEQETGPCEKINTTEANKDNFPNSSLKVTTNTKPGRRGKARKQPTVFICKHCGKDFPRKSNHDSHIRLHLTVKPHVCQFCSKAFVRRSDMNRHERSLHLKTTFKCFGKCNRQKWGCGHLYSRKDGLRKHWKSVQGQECLREFMVLNNLTEKYHEVKDIEKIIELTNLF